MQLPEPHSWDEYRFHVLRELERISDVLERLTTRIENVEKLVATIETRNKIIGGIYGFSAGAIVIALRALFSLLFRKG